jgi:hypothetical protein
MRDPAREVRRLLDGYPWAGATSRLQLLGFDVVMRASDARVTDLLTQLYAPLAVPGDAAHVLSLTAVRPGHDDGWEVHLDGTRVLRTGAASIAFRHLLWEANQQAIAQTTDAVLVHASAAVVDGIAVVMPGPMGAGKSTLVAALVQSGAGYLTDEVVAIDPASGRVRPYPKYLSVGRRLQHLVPATMAATRPLVGDQYLVAPEAIRPGAVAGPAVPRLVVAPVYRRDAATTLEELRPGEALALLAQHTFHLDRGGSGYLGTLAALVERSSCFRLVTGDVDDARAAVHELVAGLRLGVPS